jgi:hypothetical protein
MKKIKKRQYKQKNVIKLSNTLMKRSGTAGNGQERSGTVRNVHIVQDKRSETLAKLLSRYKNEKITS